MTPYAIKHGDLSTGRPGALPVRLRYTWLPIALALALLAMLGQRLSPLRAQEEEVMGASREYRIKAAYLYQFGRYVDWPESAFPNAESPFIIGVVGPSPIVADLDDIARLKKVENRPLHIQRFASPADLTSCHILFVPGTLPEETQIDALRRAAGHNMLLVGESEKFLEWGGAVRFSLEENRVTLFIARKSAQRDGLSISAKLLQVAHVVD